MTPVVFQDPCRIIEVILHHDQYRPPHTDCNRNSTDPRVMGIHQISLGVVVVVLS